MGKRKKEKKEIVLMKANEVDVYLSEFSRMQIVDTYGLLNRFIKSMSKATKEDFEQFYDNFEKKRIVMPYEVYEEFIYFVKYKISDPFDEILSIRCKTKNKDKIKRVELDIMQVALGDLYEWGDEFLQPLLSKD